MAEKRKLLIEMEKCFKKIDEGLEIFDETMNKANEIIVDNQREKLQDDLKRDIKKLQKLREQVKNWQKCTEIKEKEKLNHYRRIIEQRMETFKNMEREFKTKPHSNQGLSAEEKMDPREKERAEVLEWLNSQIQQIRDEIDRTESKIEASYNVETTIKKRGKGKDKAEVEKIEDLKKHLEKMEFHLRNLEVCMRLITNDKLDIMLVQAKLREQLDMYIDALDPEVDEEERKNLEPDYIYEELGLNDYINQMDAPVVHIEEEKVVSKMPPSQLSLDQTKGNKNAHVEPQITHDESPKFKRETVELQQEPVKVEQVLVSDVDLHHKATSKPVCQNPPATTKPGSTSSAHQPSSTATYAQAAWSSVVGKSLAPTPSTRVTLQPSVQQVHAPVQSLQPRVQSAAHVSSFLSQLPTVQPQLPTAQSQMPAVQSHLPAVQPKLPTAQPQLTTTVKSRNTLQHNSSSVKSARFEFCFAGWSMRCKRRENCVARFNIFCERSHVPVTHVPSAAIPKSFPRNVPQVSTLIDNFARMELGTLLFVFYYMEGTRAQYLAALALKNLSWRFHTRYLMWFQRVEDPVETTSDFERGRYVYFNYDSWEFLISDNFIFNYEYLEDLDLR